MHTENRFGPVIRAITCSHHYGLGRVWTHMPFSVDLALNVIFYAFLNFLVLFSNHFELVRCLIFATRGFFSWCSGKHIHFAYILSSFLWLIFSLPKISEIKQKFTHFWDFNEEIIIIEATKCHLNALKWIFGRDRGNE